ncbi:MAG: FAD:protein FMN transferase [Comamonadaceae bacterium]|nr:MAG: FAD:protein FMN transferase [Comamonadaceae bacterium]
MRVHYGPALLNAAAGVARLAPADAAPGGAGLGTAPVRAPTPVRSFALHGYAPPALRQADPAALHQLAGETMGTTWSVRLGNPHFLPLEPARQAVQKALDLVVQQMSHWEPGSDLSRFNGAAAGTWQVLPQPFWDVLTCAFDWARESGGAWDPTVGPLVQAWGFGPQAGANATARASTDGPDPQHLAQARARVGYGRVGQRPAARQALQPGGTQIDLSGIAKGYAVDLVVQHLKALGYADFLVEVGGELRASGRRPDGRPWRVAVASEEQGAAAGAPRALALNDMAIATSGDLYHAYERGGRRYSHTIDPRTGEPVAHALASVTVLHPECMHADALATVLTVLGPREGLAFAQSRGLAALLCERTAAGPAPVMTSAFAALTA